MKISLMLFITCFSFALNANALTETYISFVQQGTYCNFQYIEKPERGLKEAFKNFFEKPECSGSCGSFKAVTVNTESNSIYWDWENCGSASSYYTEISEENVDELSFGNPTCPTSN